MRSKMSRRAVLGGAATALSITSAPIVAPAIAATPIDAGAAADPFLVALEAWRQAYADWLAALDSEGRLSGRLEADGRGEETADHTRIEFGVRQIENEDGSFGSAPAWLVSHEQIDGVRTGAKKRAELHAAFDAKAAWLQSAQQANGLKATRETQERLARREHELLCAACYVPPTTPAGALAFVRFIDDEVLFDEKSRPGGADGERAVRQSIVTLETALAALFGIPRDSVTHVDARLIELWRLRREAYQVLRAAGAPSGDDVDDQLCDPPIEIEAEIQKLQPATSNLLAALTLIEIGHVCDPREMVNCPNGALMLAVRLLAPLRPLLSGAIAEEVGELLDSPGLPLGVMALWPHSVNLSPAELEALNERTTAELREAWRRHDAHSGRLA